MARRRGHHVILISLESSRRTHEGVERSSDNYYNVKCTVTLSLYSQVPSQRLMPISFENRESNQTAVVALCRSYIENWTTKIGRFSKIGKRETI